MNPTQAAARHPDFTAHFCLNFTCSTIVRASPADFSALRRLCGKPRSGVVFCDVEYKVRNGWIHIYATLNRDRKGSARVMVNLHHFRPKRDHKASIVGHFDRFLQKMSQIRGEYELSIGASFHYPRSTFESIVQFPIQLSTALPGQSSLQVVGLRLEASTPPLESVILDVAGRETILVSPALRIQMPINEDLPTQVLEKTRAVADRFVRAK